MMYLLFIKGLVYIVRVCLWLKYVLSGFALHLPLHFGRSFSNHSYRYAFSNDRPNCFASYKTIPGSLVKYAGCKGAKIK